MDIVIRSGAVAGGAGEMWCNVRERGEDGGREEREGGEEGRYGRRWKEE